MARHHLDRQPRRRPDATTVVMVLVTLAIIAAGLYALTVSRQGNDPGRVYPAPAADLALAGITEGRTRRGSNHRRGRTFAAAGSRTPRTPNR